MPCSLELHMTCNHKVNQGHSKLVFLLVIIIVGTYVHEMLGNTTGCAVFEIGIRFMVLKPRTGILSTAHILCKAGYTFQEIYKPSKGSLFCCFKVHIPAMNGKFLLPILTEYKVPFDHVST